jgi:D-3-phosphoglycerate dehydrogenase
MITKENPLTSQAPVRALLLENVHPDAAAALSAEGFEVETVKSALDPAELAGRLAGVSLLGIRSKTDVTEQALEHADTLLAIGAFCIGTNQIDLRPRPPAASPCSTRRSPTPEASSSSPSPRSSR